MALVNEYTFGEMTGTSLMDSIGGNTGTLGGATNPTWTKSLDNSKVRTQLDFTGGNGTTAGNRQRVELTRTPFEYSTSSNFSVAVLFKSSKSDGNNHTLFSVAEASAYGDIDIKLDSNEKIICQLSTLTTSVKYYVSTNTYCDGKWHFLVFTFASSGLAMNMYIDGVLRNEGAGSSGTLSGNFYSTNAKATIGAKYNHATTSYVYDLTGSIAYFANWNHTLTAAEVQRITEEQLYKVNSRDASATYRYLPPKNTVNNSLRNRYILSSPDGVDTVKDYALLNNGTKAGTTKPTTAVASNGVNYLNFGTASGATQGDRERVNLTLADFSYAYNSSFTINTWFRRNGDVTNTETIFAVSALNSDLGIWIDLTSADVLRFSVYQGTTQCRLFSTTPTYIDNKWHMATLVFSNNTLTCYVDGKPAVGTATNTGTPNGNFYNANCKALIGTKWSQTLTSYNYDFGGDILMLENFTTALDATEVDKLYRDTFIN